jgi:acetate kinase
VRRYAVPFAWTQAHGVERFGFHGLAHESLYRSLAARCGEGDVPERVVTLQLGNGCSAAALHAGRPVETSMGFTPLEGLVMATRCGDLDPGILPYLVRQGHEWPALEEALNRESGLRALSQQTGDMRELCLLEAKGHRGAALAIAAFCHRVRKYVGAYAAVLGGLDALVFGGGIGENAAEIRARIGTQLEWLGLSLDSEKNARARGTDAVISAPGSAVRAYVFEVDEEALVAEAVVACLDEEGAAPWTGPAHPSTNEKR